MATALPAATDFTGSSITEADFKDAMTDLRTYLSDLLGTDGEDQTALKALGSIFHTYEYKTAAYSVTTSDNGKLIAVNGTYTVTTPDSTATGNGFTFAVAALSGTVTIDGYSTQTVDGSASVTLAAGESCFVYDDGSNWRTFGKTQTIGTGSVTGAMLATSAKAHGEAKISTTDTALTTTYATYITDSITVSANSKLVIIAGAHFDPTSDAGYPKIRLQVAGSNVAEIIESRDMGTNRTVITAYESGALGAGAKTINLQVALSSNGSLSSWVTDGFLHVQEVLA